MHVTVELLRTLLEAAFSSAQRATLWIRVGESDVGAVSKSIIQLSGTTTMGDKSPKSVKKLANQKDVKTQADNRKKKAAIDPKRKDPPKK